MMGKGTPVSWRDELAGGRVDLVFVGETATTPAGEGPMASSSSSVLRVYSVIVANDEDGLGVPDTDGCRLLVDDLAREKLGGRGRGVCGWESIVDDG